MNKIKFLKKFKYLFTLYIILYCLTFYTNATYRPNYSNYVATIQNLNINNKEQLVKELNKFQLLDIEELKILANTVWYEAQSCTNRHQQLVAQVVMNRVDSVNFPNTIKEVVIAPNQYRPFYIYNLPSYFNSKPEMQRCFDNALKAYTGEVNCPSNVVFQSGNPKLGQGNYETIIFKSPWLHSTTYFNFG